MSYFFDTYAVIEIIRNNQSYSRFLDSSFVITELNLIELHYNILKESLEAADIVIEKYSRDVQPLTKEIIKKANLFRLQNKSKNFSTADAIGYTYAIERGLRFVTGDKQFEGMANVEFVR